MDEKNNRFFDILSIKLGDEVSIFPYRSIENLGFSIEERAGGVINLNERKWYGSKSDFEIILEKYKSWCSDCSQIEFEISILADKIKEVDSIIDVMNETTKNLQRVALPISELADKFIAIKAQ